MASGNWIVDNLNNALDTWNDKLSEIWQLLTQSPETFKGGGIWNLVVDINGTSAQEISTNYLPISAFLKPFI